MPATQSFEMLARQADVARGTWRSALPAARPTAAANLAAALLNLAEACIERHATDEALALVAELRPLMTHLPTEHRRRLAALEDRLSSGPAAADVRPWAAPAPTSTPRRQAAVPPPSPTLPASSPKRGGRLPGAPAKNSATGDTRSFQKAAEQARVQTVWFGTNRRPLDPATPARAFGDERDQGLHVGTCEVYVPKSHKFGSLGSSWFWRVITRTDDRLKVQAVRVLTDVEFWAGLRAKIEGAPEGDQQALVFIHGYNVSFEEAALRAGQIAEDLRPPGVTAFFSWPSKGSLAGYPADEATIEFSVPYIRDFLVRVVRESGARRVHVIAHSMGNRGLMRALEDIAQDAALRGAVKFGQVILAAPDIDAAVFRQVAAVYPQLSERTTLYASPGDKALEASKHLHQYPRAGFTPPVTVVPGVDTIEVPQLDLLALGHGYFADFAGVLEDIHVLLRHNVPPEKRQRPRPVGGHWLIKT
ncbi:MAG: alpha/beta hydrolase [Limisphaerales bacterium]